MLKRSNEMKTSPTRAREKCRISFATEKLALEADKLDIQALPKLGVFAERDESPVRHVQAPNSAPVGREDGARDREKALFQLLEARDEYKLKKSFSSARRRRTRALIYVSVAFALIQLLEPRGELPRLG